MPDQGLAQPGLSWNSLPQRPLADLNNDEWPYGSPYLQREPAEQPMPQTSQQRYGQLQPPSFYQGFNLGESEHPRKIMSDLTLSKVLRALGELKEEVQALRQETVQMRAEIKMLGTSSESGTSDPQTYISRPPISLPLTNFAELEEMEQMLLMEVERQKLITYYTTLGGHSKRFHKAAAHADLHKQVCQFP
ncbi:hypothetical protein MATL_G00039140 [Megalops atlanticus]|uniref:Uncharacterized protein n=1 Tax=Megalops atlanticus TaxID=7932 RepID=A0A9D3QBZ0_MEGAT|nr:hypothetical protein MATL_G00039140 [Megalops atlanticus]